MATDTKSAPQQFGRPSRKGKTAWRKHVDITDVQAGLENLRDEIRKGGVVAEKPSDELFMVDTKGSEAVQKAVNKVSKPLKADQIIAQRSAVPAVNTRKRSSMVTNGVIEKSRKKKRNDYVEKVDVDRLRKRAYGGDAAPTDVVKSDGTAQHDPWSEKKEDKDHRFSFLEKPKPVRAPRTIKEAPISLLESKRELPALVKPRGAASYNPEYGEWDELLNQEGDKEVKAENERIKEAKAEKEKQARIAAVREELREQQEGQTEDESAWEGFESDYYSDAPPVVAKVRVRKTPAQRNKVKRRKQAEGEAKHQEAMKKRDKQAKRLHEISKELAAKEKERKPAEPLDQELSEDEEADETKLRRRRFGKTHVPEKDLELVLPEELQDSLRLLKPEGNLLKDRFRNLMVRGRIETRKPISQPKKARRTVTEKWSYKDFVVPG